MPLTLADVADFHRDGFVLERGLFTPDEVAILLRDAESESSRVTTRQNAPEDAAGRKSRLAIWFDLVDDVWSDASICPRVVNGVRILLGEDVAFYHGKVMLKEARTGGRWEWHQDYGYWYHSFYFPRLLSVFVALDPATKENGCLQVLKGSHRLGRLDHGRVGQQTGADPARIDAVEKLFERVHVEMAPGDALFFHCNLLHSSEANESERDRRAFIMCYSALSNTALPEVTCGETRPCPVGADDAIRRRA